MYIIRWDSEASLSFEPSREVISIDCSMLVEIDLVPQSFGLFRAQISLRIIERLREIRFSNLSLEE